nr:Single-stranded nucleic acid binding R3H and DNA RNA helicase domain containing protein [Haemonchus contortus]
MVFTNDHCTIVFAFVSATSELWIAGKTPLTVIEGFTRVEQGLDIYDVIRSDPNCLTMFSELEVVRIGFTSVIMPLVTFSYNHKKRKDLMVTLCNDAGTLKYTFDSHSGLVPLEPCVISVNGVLVDLRCVNYHVTAKGDVVFMGNPRNSCSDYYTLHRGKVVLIEDKEVEDGFTSAHGTGSIISGLRVFLLLQEFHGAHLVSSFACSQDGKNLLYVTNSSTSYCCDQWETTDFAKLNEERENACLDRIQLDFNVYDINEVRTSTFESIIRSRFPNLDKFIRNGNAVWIEDFLKEATNAKSKGIFHDYLILDKNLVRNRGSPTKALVEDVCRVIGVPYTTEGCFYKIGEPLLCLDDFVAERNCVLISEEGVEIEFVRELLEMQSSYFGVAFTYHKGDMPKLKLAAPEHVIRCTLLSIINPNYLRRIQTHEFLDLFAFLDQYLLHAVTADALRVMFERVNEFNVSFIFDLFESVPQLRHLIAKCFLHNLHLLTFWRNSTAASVELIRDAFVCMDLLMADEKPGNASMEFVSVQPPIIHILEDDREAQWCLFRTEDVTEVLLGAHGRDSSTEAAMIDYLENESRSNDFFQSSPADVSMPKLVMIIRSRINERESLKKSKRDRRKSSRQSGTQVEVSPTCSKEEEMEEMAICNTAPSGICNIAPSEEVMEHNENLQVECTMSDKEKNHGSPSPDRGVEVRGENESTSSTVRSAWKIPISPSSPVSTSFLLERSMTPKKRSSGKFTSKGVKYSDASSLLCETRQNTHFAPWAGTTSFQQASDVISVPLSSKKEAKIGRKSKRTALSFSEQETANLQRERAPDRNSWSESTLRFPHVTSPPKPSLAEIIKEEEHRLKEGTRRISRPLYFIEDEEHAIEELAQLYLQNVGDEISRIVCVRILKATEAVMAYYGNHGKGRTKNLHNSFDRDEPNGFKNPQYGPHVQLIDANWERQVTAKLDEFVNGTATELCFPPMERAERRRLHELARRKGLQTSSEGREPNRRCVVHRRPVPRLAAVGANETQPIRLLPEVRESLSRFISQYPIYGSAVERHVTAPKARDRSQRDISNRERPEMLVPQRSNSSAEMLQQRKMLPAYRQRDDVLRAINDHKVVLITGGTGCGKTTQVPQFLLEHASENNQPLRIVCTQPRRLPAIAVANRVARERGETLGSTVGYHIRLEQRTSPQTVLTYCTSGVLLRMLTQDDAARDISHIILDEIHEREQNTDYLLIALKQALKKRNDLKVILMSATMEGNLKLFTKYFGEKVEVKHVDIPSRLYNVERFFLGDVIAMTGFVPEESMFSSMFMSTGFQEVCSFPTIGDWSMKPEWESELPQPHPRMPETMTAPNLPSLVANNCATPSSSTPVVAAGHLVTSLSVASLSQHSKQQHTVNFMNVAQQLVNSQQSSSTHQQQQAPPSVNIPSQISHPSQQSTMVPTVYPPQPDAIYVQHAPYQQSYGQQPHGYQGGGVRQVYSQQTGTGAALQHSATWGGSMEHSFPGALPSHPDVVDLPSEALDAETLEQFRQMGYNNNDEIMTSVGYGTEWRVPDDEVQPQWQNTQSYSTIPTVAYQQGNLHSWDSQTQQQPVFYVPETCDNLPSTNSVSYFGQSMDGFHVPLHGHNTLSGAATSPANYTQPPPSIQHPHANAGYQQHNVPQPPVDTYASAIQRSEKELEMMRHQLGTALPERPKSFDPSVQQLLATRRIDQSALVNMYLKCGGQQWAEAVDLDLVMTVVKYCMDSRIEGAILVFFAWIR